MKRNHIKLMLLIAIILTTTTTIAKAQTSTVPAVGDGSIATPYEIATIDNLYWLTQNSTEWDKHYIQIANINASDTRNWNIIGSDTLGFTPIGNATIKFTGKYNGQRYKIDSLFINAITTDYVGFFGSIQYSTIDSLGITNANILGAPLGVLVGFINNSSVNYCYSTGNVSGSGNVGGLIGFNLYSTINYCYSSVSVIGTGNQIGGLVGANNNATINNSYSIGSVTGTGSYRGGLTGILYISTVNSCYSTGEVNSGSSYVGGLVGGMNSGISINNSFWNTETSGQVTSAGGIGKTTAEMQTLCTYIDGIEASWDFVIETVNGTNNYWGMNIGENGGYPFLVWQGFSHTESCCGFVDTENPILTTQNYTLQLDGTGNAILNLADVVVSASDNCEIDDTTLSQSIFDCSHNNSIINVDIILSDTSGNTTTQSILITVKNDVTPVFQETAEDSVCDGNTYVFGTQNLTIAGSYIEIFQSQLGCDSVVTLNLSVNYSQTNTIDIDLCSGSSYTYADGTEHTNITSAETYISTLTGQAINGCDSIVTENITILIVDVSVIENGITLSANIMGANYQWIDCNDNNNPISGETNQSFTATVNGSYAVIIDNGICVDTSICYTITGVGIKELNNTSINIYPNPTKGNIIIKGENIKSIKISDVNGKLIKQITVTGKQIDIDLSKEAKGIYFVNVSTVKEIIIKKIVVE